MPNKDKKRQVLGKGFDALFPVNFDKSLLDNESERIRSVELESIFPNSDQPRKNFELKELEQLSSSIKRHGILQPIIVMETEQNVYQIVAGERRWRAAKLAGLKKMPVIVRTPDILAKLEIGLTENIQRVDLNAMEQAESLKILHEQFSLSVAELATRLGKAETTIVNQLRLNKLPSSVQNAVRRSLISEGHARAIVGIKDNDSAVEILLNHCIKDGWSVRQAENYVQNLKSKSKPNKPHTLKNNFNELQNQYTLKLGKGFKITSHKNGGQIVIPFHTEKELKDILKKL